MSETTHEDSQAERCSIARGALLLASGMGNTSTRRKLISYAIDTLDRRKPITDLVLRFEDEG